MNWRELKTFIQSVWKTSTVPLPVRKRFNAAVQTSQQPEVKPSQAETILFGGSQVIDLTTPEVIDLVSDDEEAEKQHKRPFSNIKNSANIMSPPKKKKKRRPTRRGKRGFFFHDDIPTCRARFKHKKQSMLCVGMKVFQPGVTLKDTQLRDRDRVLEIEKECGVNVYTLSLPDSVGGGQRHIDGKVGARVVRMEMRKRMDRREPVGCVCFDFIRFPSHYFDPIFLHNPKLKPSFPPGKPLVDMLRGMHRENLLLPGAVVYFPTRELGSGIFDRAVELFRQELGPVWFVNPNESPLFVASTKVSSYGGYDAKKEFERLSPSGYMCKIVCTRLG